MNNRGHRLLWPLLLIGLSVLVLRVHASDDPIASALRLAQSAETHTFHADIEQRLLPRTHTVRETHLDWTMTGNIAGEAATIEFYGEDTTTLPPARILRDGDAAYIERDGAITPLDDHSGIPAAASTDLLDWLSLASNVREHSDSSLLFDITGDDYAAWMREQRLAMLGDTLAPGQTLATDPLDLRSSATGKLTLTNDGFPQRLTLILNQPRIEAEYDAQTTLFVTFDFDGAVVVPNIIDNDGTVIATASAESSPTWSLPTIANATPTTTLILLTALLLTLATRYYLNNPQRTYRTVACTLVFVLLAQPVLQIVTQGRIMTRRVESAESHPSTDQPAAATIPPATANPQSTQRTPIPVCGSADPNADTDLDGLSDFEESCIGTDPTHPDSDRDSVPDLLEVEGFTYAGQRWTTDPLHVDSNRDGLPDVSEWLNGYVITDSNGITHTADFAEATSWDDDGDDIPNLWDDDNDNDGVNDGVDLAPFASMTTTVETFSFAATAPQDPANVDTFRYVEMQVRPEDPRHLRYSTGLLDWPVDVLGQVQDRDATPDDLRLVPILELTTSERPFEDEFYGYDPRQNNTTGDWTMLLPLTPVTDGGRIVAFNAKWAYGPGSAQTIEQSASLVWVALHDADDGTTAPINTWAAEPMQVTGLALTRSGSAELAHIATPTFTTDDTALFRVLLSIDKTWGAYQDYTLREIETRLETQLNLDETWGIDYPVAMTVETYDHFDRALTAGTTGDFLHAQFANLTDANSCRDLQGNETRCVSIAIALASTTASVTASSELLRTADPQISLIDAPLMTERTLRLSMYALEGGDWQPVDDVEAMQYVYQRYQADAEQIAIEEGGTVDDVLVNALLPYVNWYGGQSRTVAFDGVAINDVPTKGKIDAEIKAIFKTVKPTVKLPKTIIKLTDNILKFKDALTEDYRTDIRVVNPATGEKEYVYFTKSVPPDALKALGVATGAVNLATGVANLIVSSIKLACQIEQQNLNSDECPSYDEYAIRVTNGTIKGVSLASKVTDLSVKFQKIRVKGLYQGLSIIKSGVDGKLSPFASATKLGKAATVIGFVIEIGLLWTEFGLTVADGVNRIQLKLTLALTLFKTILAILFFVVNFIPVVGQIISLIKAIIDIILIIVDIILIALGIDKSASSEAYKFFLKLFYDITILTHLTDATGFGTFDTDFVPAPGNADGFIVGNQIQFTAPFTGVITQSTQLRAGENQKGAKVVGKVNDEQRLRDSWAFGYYEVDDSELLSATLGTDKAQLVADQSLRDCDIVGEIDNIRTAQCNNAATITFVPTAAQRDAHLRLKQVIQYSLVYAECGLYGSVCHIFKELEATLPEDPSKNEDWIDIYFDVLPADVDQFWVWGGIENPDMDADGWLDVEERCVTAGDAVGSADFDNDGLLDGFENDNRTNFGLDPCVADGDGDGLTDDLELRYNTSGDVADGDGDGLSDGDELCRVVNGQLVGGVVVTLPTRTMRVCADPLAQDADGDAQFDGQERNSGTSPFALNDGPALFIAADPVPFSYKGNLYAVAAPGDALTFELAVANITGTPLDGALTLCLPDTLTLANMPDLQGDRAVVSNSETCGLSWSLTGQDKLLPGEVVSTTIRATANSSRAVAARDLVLSIPYDGDVISTTTAVVIDSDDPTVTIDAPTNAVRRSDDQTSVVIVGTATDPTSWIDSVTVALPDDPTTATVGLERWEVRWTLPANDGSYTVAATAVDAIGRSNTTTRDILVDGTPPTLTTAFPTAVTRSDGGGLHASFPLSGTVSDAGSGVAMVRVSIDGQPFREATLVGGAWSLDYSLDIGRAHGTHAVTIESLDNVGNMATLTEALVVDILPPSAELSSNAFTNAPYPTIDTSGGFTLTGFANDAGFLPPAAQTVDLVGTIDTVRQATVWLGADSIDDLSSDMVVTWLGDVNGDGRGDAAIGLPAAERVHILYGKAGGWRQPDATELLSGAGVTLSGANIGDRIEPLGDINGDSLYDFAIADATNVSIVLGSPQAVSQALTAAAQYVYRGTTARAAGDTNGDGYDDFFLLKADTAYLLNGGLLLRDDVPFGDLNTPQIALNGQTISGVGDLNGDGFDDFALASGIETVVYAGSRIFDDTILATIASGTTHLLPLGDVNADSFADFLIDGTTPRLVLGGATPNSNTTFGNRAYGAFAAAPGDVNADGCDDILLGGSDGNGYLLLSDGCNTPVEANAVVLTEVSAAASSPYSAGADLNCDQSADLLLIPQAASTTRRELQVEGRAFVSVDQLPPAPQSATNRSNTAIITVDDDSGATYTTIQAAIDNATAGDQIVVKPGVYAGFTVDKQLTVRGESADSVFIDGDGSGTLVTIRNADGSFLTKLTLRNADTLVQIENSDIALTASVLHSFETAIATDRVSQIAIQHNTMAGGVGSGDYITAGGSADPAFVGAWDNTPVATLPTPADGGALDTWQGRGLYVSGQTIATEQPNGSWLTATVGAMQPVNANSDAVVVGDDLYVYRGTQKRSVSVPFTANNVTASDGDGDAMAVQNGLLFHWSLDGGATWSSRTLSPLASHVNAPNCFNPPPVVAQDIAIDATQEKIYLVGRWCGIEQPGGGSIASPFHVVYDIATNSYSTLSSVQARPVVDDAVDVVFEKVDVNPVNGFPIVVFGVDNGQILVANPAASAWFDFGRTNLPVATQFMVDSDGIYAAFSQAVEIRNYGTDMLDATSLARLDFNAQQWSPVKDATGYKLVDGVHSLLRDGNSLYIAGEFRTLTNGGDTLSATHLVAWDGTNWDRSITPNITLDLNRAPTVLINNGNLYLAGNLNFTGDGINNTATLLRRVGATWGVVAEGSAEILNAFGVGTVHLLTSNALTEVDEAFFQRVDLDSMVVTNLATPIGLTFAETLPRLAADDTHIYAVVNGYVLHRYAIGGGGWETTTASIAERNNPNVITLHAGTLWLVDGDTSAGNATLLHSATVASFPALTWDVLTASSNLNQIGAGVDVAVSDFGSLYLLAGAGSAAFGRYDFVTQTWTNLPLPTNAIGRDFGALVANDNTLYGVVGLPNDPTATIHTFAPLDASDDKIALSNNLFVPRPNDSATRWRSDDLPRDAGLTTNGDVWITGNYGGDYVPATTTSAAAADFRNAPRHLYKLGTNSTLANKGYHTYVPPIEVGCGGCVTTLADALNSGTQEIVLYAGNYSQPFSVPSGVAVRGVDAERVALTGAVQMEGSIESGLTQVALVGSGAETGLLVEDGGDATLERSIVRDWGTGVAARDTGRVVVRNVTLANNTAGVLAANGGCGSAEITNTAFTQNNIGIWLIGCGANNSFANHNAFWQNDSDATGLELDGSNVLQDPLFADPVNDNYRLTEQSPLIDVGVAPPNSRFTPDIGYYEFAGADLYVDGVYCATCANDGLVFGRTAFATISDAMTEAADLVRELGCGANSTGGDVCDTSISVQVAAGEYNESVDVPSHVQLVGSGAEQTRINGTPAVRFQSVIDASVRGFTLSGTDAAVNVRGESADILIAYNILTAAQQGVVVRDGSNAIVNFNTFANLTQRAVWVFGADSYAQVANSIFSNTATALAISSDGWLNHAYNLFWQNTNDFSAGLVAAESEIFNADPLLDGEFAPVKGSPAVDAANPLLPTPASGGAVADLGYRELTAPPLVLLFGEQGQSCLRGNVGVSQVEVGLVPVVADALPFDYTPAAWTMATLAAPTAVTTGWTAALPQQVDGDFWLYARSRDTLGNQTTLATDWYIGRMQVDNNPPPRRILPARRATTDDGQPPNVTLDPSGIVTRTHTFSGSVSDVDGVKSVAVSLDGGYEWKSAAINGNSWSLAWEAPRGSDRTRYPLRVRATDLADNSITIAGTLLVDNLPPDWFGAVTFSIPSDFHYNGEQTVAITLPPLAEADRQATILLNANQTPADTATTLYNGGSVTFDAPGDWYIHVRLQDRAGNITDRTFGAWHVGGQFNSRTAGWEESIVVDGTIDVLRDEWIAAETIDNDERAATPQTFYTNWDGDGLYLGWQGANWAIDGMLTIYLDTGAGGTSDALGDHPPLPFDADYAVTVTRMGDGTLLAAPNWQPTTLAGFTAQHGNGRGTEMFMPYAAFGGRAVRVVAVAQHDNGTITSVFPTTNGLAADWNDFYSWDTNLTIAPADNQPRAINAALSVQESTPTGSHLLANGDRVALFATVTNNESQPLNDLAIGVDLSSYLQLADGATQPFALPTIQPGETASVVISADVNNAPANALTPVSITVRLISGAAVTVGSQPHVARFSADTTAPTLTIRSDAVGTGGFIFGTAQDSGSGVALVEWRVDGGAWQQAHGRTTWRAPTPLPSGSSLLFEARATDEFGNVSAVQQTTVVYDNVAPDVSADVPTTVNNNTPPLTGTAADSSGVQSVEVRYSDGVWRDALFVNGVWQLAWVLPPLDSQPISLTVRATDHVENIGDGTLFMTTVDNIAPVLTATQVVTEIEQPASRATTTVVEGTVSDGSGIFTVTATVILPSGAVQTQTQAVNNGAWAYTVTDPEQGRYYVRISATDAAGNTTERGTFQYDVVAEQLAIGLQSMEAHAGWSLLLGVLVVLLLVTRCVWFVRRNAREEK